VRDSNAALTVTSVVFSDVYVIHPIPNYTTGGSNEYVIDLDEDEWIRLAAGEGIALRTQVAGPGDDDLDLHLLGSLPREVSLMSVLLALQDAQRSICGCRIERQRVGVRLRR
jgi:hypothetical protein